MAVTGTLIGIGVVSNYQAGKEQEKANRAQRRAQEEANQIERRRAEIANQRERKKAAQQAQSIQASNIASAFSGGVGAMGSSLLGANLGARSDLGSAIGFQNMNLAAASATSNVLQRGADQSAKYMNRANNYAAVGNLAGQAAPMFRTT